VKAVFATAQNRLAVALLALFVIVLGAVLVRRHETGARPVAKPAGGGQEGRKETSGGGMAFRVPIFDRDQRIVALLNGIAVRPTADVVPLATVRLDYFDRKGDTNLTMLGTNCVYDLKQQTAASPDRLRLLTGDGRLSLDGRNWFWWQTNYDLVISNDVVTLVQQRDTPVPLRITSDFCFLKYQSNLVTYTGHVRALDARLDLTCQTLTIQRGTNGANQTILADRDVVLVNRQGGGRATGGRAVFTETSDGRVAELLDSPQWSDGARSGSADRFVFDQTRHTLLALGWAQLRLPRRAPAEGGLLSLGGTAPAPADTNAFVEVAAERLTLQFPATNGPVQSVLAETNVVIRDTRDGSVARSQRAVYADNGSVELTGEPEWTGFGARLTAGRLAFQNAPQTLDARPDARLRLPVATLRQPLAGRGALTNDHVEITSPFLTYRDGWLRFGDRVHADYFERNERAGKLDCATLAVKYTNHLEALRAAGGVAAETFPARRADGVAVARTLHCAALNAGFDAAGHLTTLSLDDGVTAAQTETATNRPLVTKQVRCDRLDARFGASNRLETATAGPNVTLTRLGASNRGASNRVETVTAERVVFTGPNQCFTFTGQPTVTAPEGRIVNADRLIYNLATGGYTVTGTSSTLLKVLPHDTNLARFLKPK
jgi:lipopolysaccharide export system protein LptA